jgi:hypothetical protein
LALISVAARHPLRCARDLAGPRRPGEPKLSALAPAVRRLAPEREARVLPVGGKEAWQTAARLARLAGRRLDEAPEGWRRRGGSVLRVRQR